jgi:hypothetical protein
VDPQRVREVAYAGVFAAPLAMFGLVFLVKARASPVADFAIVLLGLIALAWGMTLALNLYDAAMGIFVRFRDTLLGIFPAPFWRFTGACAAIVGLTAVVQGFVWLV